MPSTDSPSGCQMTPRSTTSATEARTVSFEVSAGLPAKALRARLGGGSVPLLELKHHADLVGALWVRADHALSSATPRCAVESLAHAGATRRGEECRRCLHSTPDGAHRRSVLRPGLHSYRSPLTPVSACILLNE